MGKMRITPAEHVIRTFGSVARVARAIGRDRTAVLKWRRPTERRGTGGLIPAIPQQTIILLALEQGLDITCEDLILGREVDDGAPWEFDDDE